MASKKPSRPHSGKPVSGKPGSSKFGPGKPSFGKPSFGKPSSGKSSFDKPGAGKSGLGKPGSGKPGSSKPGSSKPGSGKPARRPFLPHAKSGAKGAPSRHPPHERGRVSENWLYGLHAVQAALANPRRTLRRAVLTARAAEIIGQDLLTGIRVELAEPGTIDKMLPPGAVHQGAVLDASPLPRLELDAVLDRPAVGRRIILVLDQLSDPHNVGAILRTAAAFGVAAVVVQDRHAPPQSGALAKAASGALDLVPYIEVVNISRALEQLAERGFWRIALERSGKGSRPDNEPGGADQSIAQAVPQGDVVLVLGSEGDGIRRLVREHCDVAAFIPIADLVESLNVSNAAAIALYAIRQGTLT